jgi:hypothetical protein
MTPLTGRWRWPSWAPSIHEPKKKGSTKNGSPLHPEAPIQIIPQSVLATSNQWAKQYLLPLPLLKTPQASSLPKLLTHLLRISRVIPNEQKRVTLREC